MVFSLCGIAVFLSVMGLGLGWMGWEGVGGGGGGGEVGFEVGEGGGSISLIYLSYPQVSTCKFCLHIRCLQCWSK